MCINQLCMLLVRFLVNGRLLVLTFWESQVIYEFLNERRLAHLTPVLFKGQLYISMLDESLATYSICYCQAPYHLTLLRRTFFLHPTPHSEHHTSSFSYETLAGHCYSGKLLSMLGLTGLGRWPVPFT